MTSDSDTDLETLLPRLLSGSEFECQAALEELRALPLTVLGPLSEHPISGVRIAVARALIGRSEPEVSACVARLTQDSDSDVRQALAEGLRADPEWTVTDEVLLSLAGDEEDDVAQIGVTLLARRPALHGKIVEVLGRDDRWWGVRKAAANTLGGLAFATPDAFVTLLEVIAEDGYEPLARACAEAADRLLGHRPAAIDGVETPPVPLPSVTVVNAALAKLRGWRGTPFPTLRALLAEHEAHVPNFEALAAFGRDLSLEAERGRLPRAYHVDEHIDALVRVLHGTESRSAVLLGPTGVGKTAIVNELTHRLREHPGGPWRVIRIVPSDLLVGTKYLGEWQTRVNALLELVSAPQRVLLYVPNLQELAEVGKASNDESNVATMLSPHIDSGRIALLGEATPHGWNRGLGADPSLRRLFQRIDVGPMRRRDAREVLELVAAESELDITPEGVERLFEVAEMYMAETELPGRAISMLRRLASADEKRSFGPRDVLRTLQDATGVPADFLDDAVPLRLETVNAFFAERVMGQPAAIERVLDLVTLVKAGLADPNKPSGVLLFVGPTGVGKTELARALAELLFGDPQRLLRFDMSEFASYESYERLIGNARHSGLLTDAVRQNPFSIVLLDEIEKAHANVFDLCLQIFDAGRLTDGQGRTVSFRRAIVVMTSNLGAKVETESGIGFGAGVRELGAPDTSEIQKALGQFFRPEFLGRIDHLVIFSPLSPETADQIARREVERMLARSGITRRKLSIDIDPGVYTLLLRRGYSPALGARPLKRSVEGLILLPIARVLAEQTASAGSCLRLRARGDHVEVTVLAAEEPVAGEVPIQAPPPELAHEVARVSALRERATELEERRATLLERSNQPGFWDASHDAAQLFDKVHRIDRLLEDLARLESGLELTATNPDKRRAARFLDQHASDARRLERLFDAPDLCDAYVRLSRARSSQGHLDGVERLARMYVAWARRTRMECEVLDDRRGADGDDTITLGIGGPGAHALLAGEAGLHRLTLDKGEGRSASDLVRVDVLPAVPEREKLRERDLHIETHTFKGRVGRLAPTLEADVHLLHIPSMTALRASTPLPPKEAVAPLRALLAAMLADEAVQGPTSHDEGAVVRRYQFGGSSVIRDRRTGRSTGHVERVLGGELELIN